MEYDKQLKDTWDKEQDYAKRETGLGHPWKSGESSLMMAAAEGLRVDNKVEEVTKLSGASVVVAKNNGKALKVNMNSIAEARTELAKMVRPLKADFVDDKQGYISALTEYTEDRRMIRDLIRKSFQSMD